MRKLIDGLGSKNCWLSPLTTTSNPYKPAVSKVPSNETKYGATMVGDEYDTSPYPCTEDVQCISVRTYVQNMARLIGWIESKK